MVFLYGCTYYQSCLHHLDYKGPTYTWLDKLDSLTESVFSTLYGLRIYVSPGVAILGICFDDFHLELLSFDHLLDAQQQQISPDPYVELLSTKPPSNHFTKKHFPPFRNNFPKIEELCWFSTAATLVLYSIA